MFTPIFDRSQTIVNSADEVKWTLLIAFVLVVIVIYVFLGRATDTLIPAVALPMSLLLTVAVMYMLDFSINNLTLMALTLAIGFLVDDAIVFLENVVRRAEHGESILKATFNSAGEISFTILSMTLSLAAVFIPLVFIPGLLGRIFREFSVTIIVAILASGLVSLTLTPLMCARILGERRAGHKRAWMERHTGNFIQRVIAAYGRMLDKFLDRAWLTIPILIACILGLWFFFTHIPFTLLPPGDSGFIRGVFIAQEGSSPAQMHAFQALVNQKIQEDPAVGQFFTLAGFASRSALSQGLMFLFLKPRSERPPIDQIILRLQKSIGTIPGITAVLTPTPVLQISVGATSQTQGQYAYTISGIVPQDVYTVADELLKKLRQFKGFASVRSDYYHDTPNLRIDINRDRAATYGVSTSAIQSLLRNAYSQNYVYLIKQPDDQYQVILEVKDKERAHPGDLDDLYVRSSTSGNFSASGSGGGTIATTTGNMASLIPMRVVTSTKEVIGPQAVNHLNQFTSVTFNFNLLPNVAIGDATKYIEDAFAELQPHYPTVQGIFQGETLVFRQLFQSLIITIVAACRSLRHVCHPRNSLRKLCAPVHGFVSGHCSRGGRRPGHFVYLPLCAVALQRDRTFSLVRHREEERNHGGRFCIATNRRRLGSPLGHSRSQRRTVSSHHDDDTRRAYGRNPDCIGIRSRCRFASALGSRDRGRSDFLAIGDVIRYAGNLFMA